MHAKDALGRYGEDLATEYLESLGLVVLDRNWRCDVGELDVVARDGQTLIVCEVKTRRSERFGAPVEAVSPRKMRRMRILAIRWLDEHEVHAPEIRFDVVGILQPVSGRPVLTHIRGAQ